MNRKMKELPDQERPDEKCLRYGAAYLTDAELLAVILRTGVPGISALELSRMLLAQSEGKSSLLRLHHLGVEELCQVPGVGKVKAVQIKCIMELSRRIAKESASKGQIFESASSIADYYMEDFRHSPQEQVLLLIFNTKCRLLHEEVISKGTVSCSSISAREIYLTALQHGAVFIILLHNHPSGDPSPSQEDIRLTQSVYSAGTILGISLMDHIVLGDRSYYSFRESGLLMQPQDQQ
ncbi:MAG: DNA repair protein RadC [Eubacteriales bacterium]|nr:DNA repair protein RadC [Eubacteriales bacterium]